MNIDNILNALAELGVPGGPDSPLVTGDSVNPQQTRVSPVPPAIPMQKSNEKPVHCEDCPSHEVLSFGGKDVAGCIIPGKDMETWRRLDSLVSCPKRGSTIH